MRQSARAGQNGDHAVGQMVRVGPVCMPGSHAIRIRKSQQQAARLFQGLFARVSVALLFTGRWPMIHAVDKGPGHLQQFVLLRQDALADCRGALSQPVQTHTQIRIRFAGIKGWIRLFQQSG